MIDKFISQNIFAMIVLAISATIIGYVQMQVATTPRTVTTAVCGIEDGKLSCGETGTYDLTQSRMKMFLDSAIRIKCSIETIKYVNSTIVKCEEEDRDEK